MSPPKFGTLNPPGSQVITPEDVASAAADAVRAQVAADADRAVAAAGNLSAFNDLLGSEPQSKALVDVKDNRGKSLAFWDTAAGLFLAGMTKSVQSAIGDLGSKVDRAIKASTAGYEFDATPYVWRLNDKNRKTLALMDLTGELFLPNMGNRSVQDHLRAITNGAQQSVKSGRVFDAVADLRADNNGLRSCSAEIQRAMDLIASDAGARGPATIYFPPGVYRLERALNPRSGVTLLMAGWGKSRLLPVADQSAIYKTERGTVIENFNLIDAEIDGSEQYRVDGKYSVYTKGVYMTNFKRCRFVGCFVHDTAATGIGADFAEGVFMLGNLVERNGREGIPGSHGSSGIGLGAGQSEREPIVIANNICRGSTNYGIFIEWQKFDWTPSKAEQTLIVGNICAENGVGIGECGGDGTLISGNQVSRNIRAGIEFSEGTLGTRQNDGPWDEGYMGRAQAGSKTLIEGNNISQNQGPGIVYRAGDQPSVSPLWGIHTRGNQIERNSGAGISLTFTGVAPVSGWSFHSDEISQNGGHGIEVTAGSYRDLDIITPTMKENTGSAIHLGGGSVTGGRIFGATMRDLRGSTATQTMGITGAARLTDVDISECLYAGPSANGLSLTGTNTGLTYGRNVKIGA